MYVYIYIYIICIYIIIWKFPKMAVPPNHSKPSRSSTETHGNGDLPFKDLNQHLFTKLRPSCSSPPRAEMPAPWLKQFAGTSSIDLTVFSKPRNKTSATPTMGSF